MDKKIFKRNEDIGLKGDDVSCPVCLKYYQEEDKLLILQCEHEIHSDCILHWLTIREESQHEDLSDFSGSSDDDFLQDINAFLQDLSDLIDSDNGSDNEDSQHEDLTDFSGSSDDEFLQDINAFLQDLSVSISLDFQDDS